MEPLCRNTSWSVILYEHLSTLAPQFLLGTITGALVGFSTGFATAATLLLAYLGWKRIKPSKSKSDTTKTGKKVWFRRHSPGHFLAVVSFTAYWTLPLERWLPMVQVLLERPAIDYLSLYAFAQLLLWAVKRLAKSSDYTPLPEIATDEQSVIKKKKT